MIKTSKYIFTCAVTMTLLTVSIKAGPAKTSESAPSAYVPDKSEQTFLTMLDDRNYSKVVDAMDRLPKLYPNDPVAIAKIKGILLSTDPVIAKGVPANLLVRKAARSLGDYHASLSPEESKVVYDLLRSRDIDTVLDGLKSLRGLNVPDAVPHILPLLTDTNAHILRDSCRTLAIIGDKTTIPAIEPLLNSSMSDVRSDAKTAIEKLHAKS